MKRSSIWPVASSAGEGCTEGSFRCSKTIQSSRFGSSLEQAKASAQAFERYLAQSTDANLELGETINKLALLNIDAFSSLIIELNTLSADAKVALDLNRQVATILNSVRTNRTILNDDALTRLNNLSGELEDHLGSTQIHFDAIISRAFDVDSIYFQLLPPEEVEIRRQSEIDRIVSADDKEKQEIQTELDQALAVQREWEAQIDGLNGRTGVQQSVLERGLAKAQALVEAKRTRMEQYQRQLASRVDAIKQMSDDQIRADLARIAREHRTVAVNQLAQAREQRQAQAAQDAERQRQAEADRRLASQRQVCPRCGGTGDPSYEEMQAAMSYGMARSYPGSGTTTVRVRCSLCSGTGWIPKEQ